MSDLSERAAQSVPEVLDLTARVAAIPAPTFQEEERAAFVRVQMEQLGLEVATDAAGNVTGRRRGQGGQGAILLAAHTDTVFPAETDLTVRAEPGRLSGPGIGDNSLAVASLLTLARLLTEADLETGPDLLFCANTGEEGLGNLRGIRQALVEYGPELRAVVALEGHGLGRVTNQGVGSRRLRVTVRAPGGHSWGAFGQASAIHVLGQIIARIAALEVPAEPKVTYNVGQIEGGVSVNTIAPRASLLLDMRSADAGALQNLAGQVEEILEQANDAERGVTISSEVIGDRPAGAVDEGAPIVQTAQAVLRELGLEPRLNASSTDANAPMAAGIPAICIGLTTGGNAHRLDEYIDTEPLADGLRQLAVLTERLAVPA